MGKFIFSKKIPIKSTLCTKFAYLCTDNNSNKVK